VSKLSDLRERILPRKVRFSARLPTELPGISFTARGWVWTRRDGSGQPSPPSRVARAAALAAVYEKARKCTSDFEPAAVFHAEQQVNMVLADWKPVHVTQVDWTSANEFPLEARAQLTLDLAAEDLAKTERFTESRRAGKLDRALTGDHIEFMREVVLVNEETARLWWIHRRLIGEDPETSWRVFEEAVRPLIRIADENDPITKLARSLLTLNEYVNGNRKERLETLGNFAAFAATKMGQNEVAKTLANLRSHAAPTCAEANGLPDDG
jgi:hypothetical protein